MCVLADSGMSSGVIPCLSWDPEILVALQGRTRVMVSACLMWAADPMAIIVVWNKREPGSWIIGWAYSMLLFLKNMAVMGDPQWFCSLRVLMAA